MASPLGFRQAGLIPHGPLSLVRERLILGALGEPVCPAGRATGPSRKQTRPHVCQPAPISCRPAKCLNRGFSTSALHVWGQVVLSCGVCPVHCRVLSSTPGLCQRHPHLWGAQVMRTNVSADIARCPLGTLSPGWELLAYTQTFSLSGP